MLMTSVLLFIAMREIWGWSLVGAPARSPALFMIVDGGFFAANWPKSLQGGYVPLLLASAVYGMMWIWHRGAIAVHDQVVAEQTPTDGLRRRVAVAAASRACRASAVFLTRAKERRRRFCPGTCARTVRCTNMCSP